MTYLYVDYDVLEYVSALGYIQRIKYSGTEITSPPDLRKMDPQRNLAAARKARPRNQPSETIPGRPQFLTPGYLNPAQRTHHQGYDHAYGDDYDPMQAPPVHGTHNPARQPAPMQAGPSRIPYDVHQAGGRGLGGYGRSDIRGAQQSNLSYHGLPSYHPSHPSNLQLHAIPHTYANFPSFPDARNLTPLAPYPYDPHHASQRDLLNPVPSSTHRQARIPHDPLGEIVARTREELLAAHGYTGAGIGLHHGGRESSMRREELELAEREARLLRGEADLYRRERLAAGEVEEDGFLIGWDSTAGRAAVLRGDRASGSHRAEDQARLGPYDTVERREEDRLIQRILADQVGRAERGGTDVMPDGDFDMDSQEPYALPPMLGRARADQAELGRHWMLGNRGEHHRSATPRQGDYARPSRDIGNSQNRDSSLHPRPPSRDSNSTPTPLSQRSLKPPHHLPFGARQARAGLGEEDSLHGRGFPHTHGQSHHPYISHPPPAPVPSHSSSSHRQHPDASPAGPHPSHNSDIIPESDSRSRSAQSKAQSRGPSANSADGSARRREAAGILLYLRGKSAEVEKSATAVEDDAGVAGEGVGA